MDHTGLELQCKNQAFKRLISYAELEISRLILLNSTICYTSKYIRAKPE